MGIVWSALKHFTRLHQAEPDGPERPRATGKPDL